MTDKPAPPPRIIPVDCTVLDDKTRLEVRSQVKGYALGISLSIAERPPEPGTVVPFKKPDDPE